MTTDSVATMIEMITGHWRTQIVRAMADLDVVEHLSCGARTSDDVAARAGSDPRTTRRLMRAATSLGLLEQHDDGTVTTTDLGTLLRPNVPGSVRNMALVQGGPSHWLPWGELPRAVRSGTTALHVPLGLEPGQTLFDHYAQHPVEGAQFAAWMSDTTAGIIEDVTGMVDLSGVTTVLDVGGANGALVRALVRNNPHVRGAVLELPSVVPGALAAMTDSDADGAVDVVPGDFFVSVPPADLYLLKWILHDWNDDECVQILRNCRASAPGGARVVVVDAVIGAGESADFTAMFDMNMLSVSKGQERTLAEFDALYAASGWRRASACPTHGLQTVQELITAAP
ncbi:acetylserotonin O-methyltransferase [Lentzea alba]|uniref:methyltransferase n=1 Tax=Lentzea alba TaxID=2714351 RepID=UPI0039BF86C9